MREAPAGNGSRAETTLRVLTYHRVADPSPRPRLNPRLVSTTPVEFARQMRHLAKNYRVVAMSEVLDAVDSGRPLPRRAVLITFDDGYRDFQDVAWPILRENGLPATLFVPTEFPDHPDRAFWWDRLFRAFTGTDRETLPESALGVLPLRAPEDREASLRRMQDRVKELPHERAMELVDEVCERLGEPKLPGRTVLGWEELRRLDRQGVTIGAHTRWHPLLTRVSPERARDEVVGSQAVVQREIGHALPVFSYPNGSHDEGVVAILRQEGFRLAVTQETGFNDVRVVDPLRVRRINITRRSTFPVFRLRLHAWAARLDRWRKRKSLARATSPR